MSEKGTLISTRIRKEPTVHGYATQFQQGANGPSNLRITYSTSNQKAAKENKYCILERQTPVTPGTKQAVKIQDE